MQTSKTKSFTQSSENNHEDWFSKFIDRLNQSVKNDKMELENGDASSEKIQFYSSLIKGNQDETMSLIRKGTSGYFLENIVLGYLSILELEQIVPEKIAFDISENKVLVWLEINDDDEKAEFGLIRAEAKVNSDFYSSGIQLDSVIVEKSDKLQIPSHYRPLSNI